MSVLGHHHHHAPSVEVVHDPHQAIEWKLLNPDYMNPQFAKELGLRTIYLAEGYALNAFGRVVEAQYSNSQHLVMSDTIPAITAQADALGVEPQTAASYEAMLRLKLEWIGRESSAVDLVHIRAGINRVTLYGYHEYGYVPAG